MIHQHSVAALHEQKPKFGKRALAILAWLREHGRATDRQVMLGLGYREPNAVRPRITELIEALELEEVGSVTCSFTGKTVRLVAIRRVPPQQLSLLSEVQQFPGRFHA